MARAPRNPNLEIIRTSALTQACLDGNVEQVKQALAGKANLNGGDNGKYRERSLGRVTGAPYHVPLGDAAARGYAEIVELLLAAGARVDAVNSQNETALLAAAHGQQLGLVQRLLEAGADLHHQGAQGSVLSYAVGGGNREVIRFLLEAGVDPTSRDVDGRDAFDHLRFDARFLKDANPVVRRRAQAEVEVIKLLLPHWKGSTAKLDAALRKAGVADGAQAAATRSQTRRWAKLLAGAGGKGWSREVLKAIGSTISGRHAEVEELAHQVLAQPGAIAADAWPELVRALTLLTASYTDLMQAEFGERLSIEDEGEDESGTMELIGDEKLSTVELALELLAIPEAIARPDWAELLELVCREKRARLGHWSYGDQQIKVLLAKPAFKSHPRAKALRTTIREAFPYAKRG